MKKKEIKPALDALKSIKIPKIEDKDVKTAIIKNHLKLLAEQKKLEGELEDLQKAYLGPYEDQRNAFAELQQKFNAEKDEAERQKLVDQMNSYTELISALNSLNKDQYEKLEEDVEVELIDMDKFVEEYQNQDYDLTVVEALYPMLKV